MSDLYVCIDIDPLSGKVLGSRAQGDIIETDQPVLLSDVIFGDAGIMGFVVEEKLKLKGLKPVVRNDDGEIYTFDGRMPLLTAAYALVSPRSGVKYTNNRAAS